VNTDAIVSIPMFNLLTAQARLRGLRNNLIARTTNPGETLDQVSVILDLTNEAIVYLHDMEQKGQVTR
jgi:hypothetical protein